MNIFETLDQNLKVFLSIFCGTKVNLEFIITSILDLSPPPSTATYPHSILSYSSINVKMFSTLYNSAFWNQTLENVVINIGLVRLFFWKWPKAGCGEAL